MARKQNHKIILQRTNYSIYTYLYEKKPNPKKFVGGEDMRVNHVRENELKYGKKQRVPKIKTRAIGRTLLHTKKEITLLQLTSSKQ